MLECKLILVLLGARRVNIQSIQFTKFPTTVGCGALLVWSLYALLVSELLGSLPVFETLSFMFFVSFLFMAFRLTVKRQWSLIKEQPFLIWLIGVLGVCGSDVAYISAVKYAPPAHVDFIDYLWPFLVIIFTGFLPKERFSLKHSIGGGLGFLGVLLLLTGGQGFFGFKDHYLTGYLFALTAAVIWSSYIIFSTWYQKMPMEMVGMFCGIGALVSFGLHLQFEEFVTPTPLQTLLVLFLGLSSGIAYLFWTYGTQKGNVKMLGVLAYFTPVFSMGLLVFFEKEPMSIVLVLACIMVVSGVVVGSLDWGRVRAAVAGVYS